MAITQRRVFGFSTSLLLLVTGAVCLAFAVIDRNENASPTCGVPGYPPVRDWMFGTGISFIIIGVSFIITSILQNQAGIFKWITGLSSTFLFAWAIVGAVSLGRDGQNCQTIDYQLWQVALFGVIMNWIIWAFGGYTTYRTGQDDDE